MPPKRKKKQPTQKQKQRQSQRVTINIGKTTTTKRRNAGRGGLPPPSHLQNLAPTFVTNQQIDIPSLLNALKVQDPVPIRNLVTPLSATLQASTTAQQMAGQRAEERRAGPTAGNFQPPPSRADNRLAQAVQQQDDDDVRSAFKAKLFRARSASPVLATQVRPRRGPIPRGIQEAVPLFEPGGGGGGPPVVTPSSARPTLAQATQADGTPITKKVKKEPKSKVTKEGWGEIL